MSTVGVVLGNSGMVVAVVDVAVVDEAAVDEAVVDVAAVDEGSGSDEIAVGHTCTCTVCIKKTFLIHSI